MSETKFTPGPWEAHIGLDYFNVYNKSGSCVVPDSRCNPESERDVADAHLIAAAPEMYAALTNLAYLQSQISPPPYGHKCRWCGDCTKRAKDDARAALAKAGQK